VPRAYGYARAANSPTAFPPSRQLLRQLGRCSRRDSNSYIPIVVLLDRCSRRGSTSATAPCVALPPASLQSSSIHGVVRCSNFLRLGNRSSTAVPDAVLPPPSMESCVALPPASDRQGRWKCKRIVGNNPCPAVVLLPWSRTFRLPCRSRGGHAWLILR